MAFLVVAVAFPHQAEAQTAWFRRTIPTATEFQSVAYGGGFFSAVARGRAKVLQSRDGRLWTASPLPDLVNQVVYFGRAGREGFYGVGGTYFMRTSPGQMGYAISSELDQELLQTARLTGWNSVSTYGGRLAFLGTGEGLDSPGDPAPVIALFDNTVWKIHAEPVSDIQNRRFLLMDAVVLGSSKILFFSQATSNGDSVSHVWIRDLGGFPLGDRWTTTEITAPSGTTWGDLTAGAYGVGTNGAGTFVLVGKGGKIFRIPEDTLVPQSAGISTNASLSGVAFGNKPGVGGCWVAVGACGTVLYSVNAGQTWQSAPTRILDDLNAVTYGTNSFMAVGEGGLILQSN